MIRIDVLLAPQLTGLYLEKAHCHLLRFANGYRRRIRHSSGQGGKVQVWSFLFGL